jgi:superfamily I DNA/RNA helicase
MYRVKALLERPGTRSTARVLFTTYTRALLVATEQLLGQILDPAQMRRVQVSTCDQIAREIVATRRRLRSFESEIDARRRLAAVRGKFEPEAGSAFQSKIQARALARLTDSYLLEEFDWVITGRGLTSEQDYVAAPRPGRGIAFSDRLRKTVWALYQRFRETQKQERFPDLRNEALELVRRGEWTAQWDFVVVDEAQDLSPSSLALMAEVCQSPQGLFFAADSKQSLYSRNYTWSSAHPRLQFKGRTATLRRNYRSTKEIDTAALSVLEPEEGEEIEASTSIHEGPLPVLLRGVEPALQGKWIAQFIRQMSAHLHVQSSAAAVLVPNADLGRALAEQLEAEGLPAQFFPGRELDLRAPRVKVLTMHSAKGLEFPIVVVAGFEEGTYPESRNFDDTGLYAERMRQERRLLYVAFTRAMRGLMVIVPKDCRHEALTALDTRSWHVEDL